MNQKYAMKVALDAPFEAVIHEAWQTSKTAYEFEQKLIYANEERKAAKEIKFLLFELMKIKLPEMIYDIQWKFDKAEDVADSKIINSFKKEISNIKI